MVLAVVPPPDNARQPSIQMVRTQVVKTREVHAIKLAPKAHVGLRRVKMLARVSRFAE